VAQILRPPPTNTHMGGPLGERFVTSEPLSKKEAGKVAERYPNVRIFTHLGASKTAPGAT